MDSNTIFFFLFSAIINIKIVKIKDGSYYYIKKAAAFKIWR